MAVVGHLGVFYVYWLLTIKVFAEDHLSGVDHVLEEKERGGRWGGVMDP